MSAASPAQSAAPRSATGTVLDAIKPVQPFIAGGVAGCIAMTAVLPVDTVKVRIQVMGDSGAAAGQSKSPFVIARNIIAADGVKGLYSGITAAWARMMVYGSTRIGLFRVLSEEMKKSTGQDRIDLGAKVILGATAGAVASFVGTPCDVALVRMQSDSMAPLAERRNYSGVFNAVGRIVKEEGVFKLWRGATPTIVRAIMLNSALLATGDQMKEILAPSLGGMDSWQNIVASSFIAGIVASFASLPADMVKTRLQRMAPAADGSLPYSGLLDCAKKIVAREGPLALYTGLPTYIVRIAPYGLITLAASDAINMSINSMRAQHA